MNSVNDPWHINPSDLLNGDGGVLYEDAFDANGLSDFDQLLGINYNDANNLLSQEFKDLDIPLITNSSCGRNSYDDQTPDTSKFKFDDLQVHDSHAAAKYGSSGATGHKRGPSGTAIFGFLNHNKTLSISNLQKNVYSDTQKSYQPLMETNEKVSTSTDNNFGQTLLKQQEQLRLALERQHEVNKRLEQQLQENKLQQERLQRVLDEQEMVAHQFAADETPRTAATNQRCTAGPDNGLIITSNTKSGGFQFPPPTMISPPTSNASINGSPTRKPHRVRTRIGNKISPPSSDFEAFHSDIDYNSKDLYVPDFAQQPVDRNEIQNFPNNIKPTNTENIYKNPFCTNDQSRAVLHKKKESVTSTVSTIPQHQDDSSDSETGSLIGLGIQVNRRGSNNGRGYTLRPPPIDILPSIPGSSNNTPVGKKPQLPEKRTFQHTPIKTQQHHQHQQNASAIGFTDKLFSNGVETPHLKPPSMPIASSRRSSDYASDYPDNGEDDIDIDPHLQENDEPESRFVVAKTPSPVLKSQGKFEGSSPQFDLGSSNKGSPTKITRKPTTLPRGSIDRYVKELPDRIFECMYPNCNKVFKRRYNIRSHIQTHLEDRPYVCDFEGCDKAFVRNHDLVRHKKSHAEKTYACPCGKKFNREDALIVHRSRLICSGGKKYENVVIKKSPRKRGRPKKDGSTSVSNSPIKESVARDRDGYLMFKMEEQLRNEMEMYGLLKPPSHISSTAILSPAANSGRNDSNSP